MSENKSSALDRETEVFIIMAVVIAAIAAFIYFVPQVVTLPWAIITFIEASIVKTVTYPWPDNHYHKVSSIIIERLTSQSWFSLSISSISKVDNALKNILFPFYFLLSCFVAMQYKQKAKHKTRHNMDSLIRNLSTYFGFNRYLITRNPIGKNDKTIDPSEGYAGMGDKPLNYMRKYGVLSDVIDKSGSVYCRYIDKKKLYELFLLQLGPVNNGLDLMERPHKWFVTMMICILCGDRRLAETINYNIGFYYNKEYKISKVETLIKEAIAKYASRPEIVAIIANHAFVYTLMFRMYHDVKGLGSTPPNHYGYLFFEDRLAAMLITEEGKAGSGPEAYLPQVLAMDEKQTEKPLHLPDKAIAVSTLEAWIIEEYDQFKIMSQDVAESALTQPGYQKITEGEMPENGYWTLRYVKMIDEMPKHIQEDNLYYPPDWSDQLKRLHTHAVMPSISKGVE